MLSVEAHVIKARHDEKFVESFDLDRTLFLDWVVTGYFYSALHYVGAYLKTKGRQSFAHQYTDTLLLGDIHLDRIYDDYCDLKNDSEEARYGGGDFDSKYIRSSCRAKLNSIKKTLRPFLSS